MAELATVARPYAEALFLATDPTEAAGLAADLQRLAQVAADAQLRAYADNPKVSAEQVVELVLGVLPDGLPSLLQNLLQTVVENGRLGRWARSRSNSRRWWTSAPDGRGRRFTALSSCRPSNCGRSGRSCPLVSVVSSKRRRWSIPS